MRKCGLHALLCKSWCAKSDQIRAESKQTDKQAYGGVLAVSWSVAKALGNKRVSGNPDQETRNPVHNSIRTAGNALCQGTVELFIAALK